MITLFAIFSLMVSCSTTAGLPEGEKLYIGLKEITWGEHETSDHFNKTQEELNAALQTAPNGALFGSSYLRTPFPYGLWIWNAYHGKEGAFAKWITKSFGKQPVLMNNVNPTLRSKVAENILKNHGYFNGKVNFSIIETDDPKKEKISYHIETGDVFRIDTLSYANFPAHAERMIINDTANSVIKKDTPFSTATLDTERNRVTKLLRDSGYYYYHASYASYLADTLIRKNRASLRLQMADSIPKEAQRQWRIGNITLDIKRQFQEELTDSVQRRHMKFRYNGKKSPVRARVIMSNMKIYPRRLYNYQQHTEANTTLTTMGLFSNVNFQFTPRDNDTLDLNVLCVLDKPYDFYIQTNFVHTLSGRTGPELKIGLTRKNAFRGGEKFDINLHSAYAWQGGHSLPSSDRNSYEVGMDASIEWPRLLIPFINRSISSQNGRRRRLRFAISPATKMTGSFNVIHRPGYYRMHSASGEWSYIWKPKLNVTHQLSPFILTYQKLNYRTEQFDSILNRNSYMKVAMQDMFIPKLQYTFTYASPAEEPNPIFWYATITEAGNFTSLINKLFFGQDWTETNKTMFKNIYAQFLKIQTDFRKTWRLNDTDNFVFHANAGVVWSYGNMKQTPYTEQFYIGGANSVRAFSARSLGPGSYKSPDRTTSYVDQTGDIHLLLNLEYRKRLFGNLHGAIFLDAGNVWAMHDDETRQGEQFRIRNIFKETALGTGIGIRYDLDFLILRLDWGIGLHAPYTNNHKFYNFSNFKDSHTLHFAIGYPF
ncbi:MAG: BamA/TamA family outer membrane protein [Bacteroidaceae bacterium]|nr:BamA/TamA family outer membrane protein [Bacteroidaceae bacterium]